MPETIICVIMFIPAVVGVIAIVQEIMLAFVTPKGMNSPILIIPFNSENDDVEFILKSAGFRAQLYGHKYCSRVIAVDRSENYYDNEICLKSCDDMDFIEICNYDELLQLIEKQR
ncbi:MAG: hypothetical protein IKU25_08780 [Clostridia bacterium]|nr:hypothetical protein [Clostridia bacterium]